MSKILFFGGKGGVGKTSCSSAFAIRHANSDKKVLLVSTDQHIRHLIYLIDQ